MMKLDLQVLFEQNLHFCYCDHQIEQWKEAELLLLSLTISNSPFLVTKVNGLGLFGNFCLWIISYTNVQQEMYSNKQLTVLFHVKYIT